MVTFAGQELNFAELLQLRLAQEGRSGYWLAEEVECDYETTRNWIIGEKLPMERFISKISRAIGVAEEIVRAAKWQQAESEGKKLLERNPAPVIGDVYGNLIIIGVGEEYRIPSKGGFDAEDGVSYIGVLVRCLLDGNEKVIYWLNVYRGRSTTCGCGEAATVERYAKILPREFPVGTRKDHRTVVAHTYAPRRDGWVRACKVRCDCGREDIIIDAILRREVWGQCRPCYVRELRSKHSNLACLSESQVAEALALHESTADLKRNDPRKWTGIRLARKFDVSDVVMSKSLQRARARRG